MGYVATMIVRLIVLGIGCALLYLSYDSFRAALTGTQPTTSVPNTDPKSVSTRSARLLWGIMSLAMASFVFFAWIKGWGPWKPFYGG